MLFLPFHKPWKKWKKKELIEFLRFCKITKKYFYTKTQAWKFLKKVHLWTQTPYDVATKAIQKKQKSCLFSFDVQDQKRCQLVKKIGSGVSSHVYLYHFYQFQNQPQPTIRRAVKEYNVPNASHLPDVLQEYTVHSHLEHPFLMSGQRTRSRFWSVMPEGVMSLGFSSQIRRWSPFQKKHLIFQLFLGLEYLHRFNYIHADLKSSNLIAFPTQASPNQKKKGVHYDLKISDFGLTLSHLFWNDYQQVTPTHLREVQTLYYRAPELLVGETEHLSTKIDIWSAGCVLFEWLCPQSYSLSYLFASTKSNPQRMDQLNEIFQVFDPLPRWHSKISFSTQFKIPFPCQLYIQDTDPMAWDLMKKCLEVNPQKRLSSKQALGHPYFDEIRLHARYRLLLRDVVWHTTLPEDIRRISIQSQQTPMHAINHPFRKELCACILKELKSKGYSNSAYFICLNLFDRLPPCIYKYSHPLWIKSCLSISTSLSQCKTFIDSDPHALQFVRLALGHLQGPLLEPNPFFFLNMLLNHPNATSFEKEKNIFLYYTCLEMLYTYSFDVTAYYKTSALNLVKRVISLAITL